MVQAIGELFGLHPLAVEDVHHTHQRSKVEEYDGHLFIVVRMASMEADELRTEQLSIFLRENVVITFQEGRPGDCLQVVRERARRERSATRRGGADFLMYQILDASIDSYYAPLADFGNRLDTIEDFTESSRSQALITELHSIRRDLLTMRRVLWPLRDAINSLLRSDNDLLQPETRLFLRDCHDHTFQLIDMAETFREVCSDLRELQYATINQRTNEVMRLLTMIATVFMPLNFVAALYGMNFNPSASPWNMPELSWRFGYLFALGVMATIGCGMVGLFWRWGWLRRHSDLK
jgi:magnesium transporter